jgi:hypothetical protein
MENPGPDGWTEIDDCDVAKALNYPTPHPGFKAPVLDIEYRDMTDERDPKVGITYYCRPEDLDEAEEHFERYRGALEGVVELQLWVEGARKM